jgi:pimeloyl-ACP methyl ester carboxylesterase
MGHSTTDGLNCNDDVVTLLADFIDHVSGEPVLLLGHSLRTLATRSCTSDPGYSPRCSATGLTGLVQTTSDRPVHVRLIRA